MKNKILLIMIVLFVAGCSAKVEVEIKNEKVVEKKSFIIDKSSVKKESIYYTVSDIVSNYFPSADFIIGDKTKEFYDDNNAIYQKIDEHKIDKYSKSDIFGFCYDAHNVVIGDGSIMISTSDKFKCFDYYKELDAVEVIIKSNHKLIETNADIIDGYVYKWNVTEDNADTKKIYLKLHQDKYVFNYEYEFTKKVCIVGVIILILAIATLVFIKKRRNSTRF